MGLESILLRYMLMDYYVEKSILFVDVEEKGILGLPFKMLKEVNF
jgi:hypothetical protein